MRGSDVASASCPQETSDLQAVARALCVHAIRQRRRWDTPAEEVEAMIAKGDVVDMAWRDFIWEAAVAISALENSPAGLADAHSKSPSRPAMPKEEDTHG